MDSLEMMGFADQLANQLVEYGAANGIAPRDLLMAASLGVRMLQRVYPGSVAEQIAAIQEAEACFVAHTHELSVN